jgi:hypothetical protein
MKELDQLNSQPVNVLAKVLLKKAGVKPQSSLLYLYQLPKWALENGEVKIEDVTNHSATTDLLNGVEMLLYQVEPKKAMNFLLQGENPYLEPSQFAKQREPQEAAAYLCDRIRAALIEGDYPNQSQE